METKKETKLLQPGDVIYGVTFHGISGKFVVRNATPKRVTADCVSRSWGGIYQFSRDVSDKGTVKLFGTIEVQKSTYYLETPELKSKYFKKVSIEKLNEYKFEKCSEETIKKIVDLLQITI